MENFNALSIYGKCSILQEHGRFVSSWKSEKSEYAIYVLDRLFDFSYAILFREPNKPSIKEISILENSEVADFIDVRLNDLFI